MKKDHYGALLVAGGICLKLGAIWSSLLLAAPGYIILAFVISYKVKTWRDKDDHQD